MCRVARTALPFPSLQLDDSGGGGDGGGSESAVAVAVAVAVSPHAVAPSIAASFDADPDAKDIFDSTSPLQPHPNPPDKHTPSITFEEVQALIKDRSTDYGYGPVVLQNLNVYEVLAAQMRKLLYAAAKADRVFVVQECLSVLKSKLFMLLDRSAASIDAGNPERTLIRLPKLVSRSVAHEKVNSFRWPKTERESHQPECWPVKLK